MDTRKWRTTDDLPAGCTAQGLPAASVLGLAAGPQLLTEMPHLPGELWCRGLALGSSKLPKGRAEALCLAAPILSFFPGGTIHLKSSTNSVKPPASSCRSPRGGERKTADRVLIFLSGGHCEVHVHTDTSCLSLGIGGCLSLVLCGSRGQNMDNQRQVKGERL